MKKLNNLNGEKTQKLNLWQNQKFEKTQKLKLGPNLTIGVSIGDQT